MLKRMHHYSLRFKGELLFMAANYVTPMVGFIASLVATRYVVPRQMGGVQTALLLIPYLSLLHFGAFAGLNRNLAYYLGKGDQTKAMRMVSASAFMARINAGLGLLCGGAFLLFHATRPEPDLIVLVAGAAVLVILLCTPYITHISATYRSGQHFKQFAGITWADNGARMVYCLLPAVIGWVGYVISLMIQPLIKLGLLKTKEPYPTTKSFKWSDLKELIHVGFPIMAYGYFASLLMVADQSLVALFMGKEQLGYFALSRLTVRVMVIIPATLSILISPKVAACYGRTDDPRSLRKYVWGITGIHIVFILPICLIGWITVGPLVKWLLPDYTPGIRVAQITLLTCLGYIFSGLLTITSTLRKNLIPIIFYCVALVFMWLSGWGLFRYGSPTIEKIAWLRFLFSLALSISIFIYTYIATDRRPVEEKSK